MGTKVVTLNQACLNSGFPPTSQPTSFSGGIQASATVAMDYEHVTFVCVITQFSECSSTMKQAGRTPNR